MPRWKVPDLVRRDKGCVAHAFSVMRLALGYKTGWVEGLEMEENPTLADVTQYAMKLFPGRHVMVIDTNAEGGFAGDFWEGYLLAYCYKNKGSKFGHMVIGSPVTDEGQCLDLLIAVSIKRFW